MSASKPRRPASVGDLLRVDPTTFDLAAVDPRAIVAGPTDKATARAEVAALEAEASDLQERLYAASRGGSRSRLVVVAQGMDTAGKGGTAKVLDRLLHPLGFDVVGFGKPTEEELAHHFLWRVERQVPEAGRIRMFDRSHYEDVLIVRVRGLVPPEVWEGRYDEINAWEQRLVDQGVVLLKCMLHISSDEQRNRLAARLDNPAKRWKYNPADVDERQLWPDYMTAYQAALTRCSTPWAPWYVIPADRKWYRDWLIAQLLVETLRRMRPDYPPVPFDVDAERARLAAS